MGMVNVAGESAEVHSDGATTDLSSRLQAALAEVAALKAKLAGQPNCSCNAETEDPAGIDPQKAKNHELRDEIDRLYKAERDRQVLDDLRFFVFAPPST